VVIVYKEQMMLAVKLGGVYSWLLIAMEYFEEVTSMIFCRNQRSDLDLKRTLIFPYHKNITHKRVSTNLFYIGILAFCCI